MDTSLLTAVACAGLALLALSRLKGSKASSQTIKEQIAAGALVVDVRTPGEFRGGAYPGAKNIPLQELGSRMAELPKDRGIVVYCASGSRSAFAVRTLTKAGYSEVVNGGGLMNMSRA